MIDEKVLVERLEEHCGIKNEVCDCNGVCSECDFRASIEIVNQLAEEYNNGWISVNDGVPNTYDNLLICQSDGYVNVGWYSLNEFKDMNSVPYKNVIAWQPLPAPYQPKGE